MRYLTLFLLLVVAVSGATDPRLSGLADVAVGSAAVDGKLLYVLGGVDDGRIQQRLAQTISRSALPLGSEDLRWDRGVIDVKVDGYRASARQYIYLVTVSLKRLVRAPGTAEGFLSTVDTRTIYGMASPSGLAVQVMVAVEEQTEDLLGQVRLAQVDKSRVGPAARSLVALAAPRR
ncbi:MAG: hypothetical protein HYV95_14680 [Opitutae bacterium]|nr:hypothetical protein [Opitutae bacterium]